MFNHEIINSEDDLYDIFLYTKMDIYIQGTSSFSTMSSFIRPAKIIITNHPENIKYTFNYNNISSVYRHDDITYLNFIENMFIT